MVTQLEIDAAAQALTGADHLLSIDNAVFLAKLAIEAAERVRPKRKDGTQAARARRYRAKRNGVTGERNAERHDVTTDHAERHSVTGDSNAVTGNGNAVALLAKLKQVAHGNVHPAATNTSAIAALLDQGCDLDLDVLPAVRHLLADPLQPPLRRWHAPWLVAEIVRRRDARTGGTDIAADGRRQLPPLPLQTSRPRTSVPPSPPAPGLPSLDLGELVAGYRAGMVEWNVARLGPPPGLPGCRVGAAVLKENGY